jgi:translation initiation factor IF-2
MPDQNKNNLKQRPPIVVVMGHVDHGKTTLLDYIRKTNIAGKEAGSITQAVGAYEITHMPQTNADSTQTNADNAQIDADRTRINADKITYAQTNADGMQTNAENFPRGSASSPRKSASPEGRKITFIDTPGHEAFSKMRSRGAEVADIAVLVVAADEGVKPQTKEAVNILTESKTPFVVAITKIDKPGSDIERVKNELTAQGVLLEGYGGQVSYHGVSSKTGEGINDLLDLIVLATDVENLTFDPQAPASGYVLEAKSEPKRGIEAAVIVKNGVLKLGSQVYTQTTSGKVKILEDFLGNAVESLEPSAPALIFGFEKMPEIGDTFSSEPIAISGGVKKAKLAFVAGQEKALNLIIKSSDAGSLEALSAVIKALKKGDKQLNIIDESVGNITDGDVKNAIATKSVIIGFKNKIDKAAQNLAQAQEAPIITSDIIYDLVKAVEEFLEGKGKLAVAGKLEVLAVFNQDKPEKQLVGGRVTEGIFRGKANFEIWRGGDKEENKIGEGRVLSLQEKKSDITQAEAGKEIGVLARAAALIQIGDLLVIKK